MSKALIVEMMQGCPLARQAIEEIIKRDKAELADFFYAAMLADQEATAFLTPQTVQSRLRHSMMHWMETLFCCDTASAFEAAIAMQRHVGDVHARADIPVNLVARGMRLLKREIQNRLVDTELDRKALVEAILLVDRLSDIAFEDSSVPMSAACAPMKPSGCSRPGRISSPSANVSSAHCSNGKTASSAL